MFDQLDQGTYLYCKYCGPKTNGFIPQHEYDCYVDNDTENKDGIIVKATFDNTEDEEVDIEIRLSSQNSFKKYFLHKKQSND